MRTTLDSWERLAAGKGLIAVAGAGGKKSTMYALASRCPGRVAVTTTVNCPFPPRELRMHPVIEEEATLLEAVRDASRKYPKVFFGLPGKHVDRAAGVPGDLIARIHAERCFDTILVKADGARHRLIKAPAASEPVYPVGVDMVLYLVSAHALGRKLGSGVAHRQEELMAVTGASEASVIEPAHIVKLLTSEVGALKGVAPGTCIVPVINRVDTAVRHRQALEIAKLALAASTRLSAVVFGCMGDAIPRMELVERS